MDVLIAGASAVEREELRFLFSDLPGIDIIGEAAGPEETLRTIRARNPHVVVLDTWMPSKDEFTVLRRMRQRRPVPVLVMLREFACQVLSILELETGGEFVRGESLEGQPLILALTQLVQEPMPV